MLDFVLGGSLVFAASCAMVEKVDGDEVTLFMRMIVGMRRKQLSGVKLSGRLEVNEDANANANGHQTWTQLLLLIVFLNSKR
jgi:hypothetical protein